MRYNVFIGGNMKLIERKSYLNQLINVIGAPDIKVITGIRRAGKSVLIDEYASYLSETEDNLNLVVIKLQDLDFEELLDAQSELRVPILYCNIKPNKESLFYIKYDKDILIYKLKSDLYENDSKIKNKSDGYEEENV